MQLYTHDVQWLEDPRAMRLFSAAYSFVMTLSHFLPGTYRFTCSVELVVRTSVLMLRSSYP